MRNFAAAWVVALVLGLAGVAGAQTSHPPNVRPPHVPPSHVPHPGHSMRPMPPVAHRTPQPMRTSRGRRSGRNVAPYGAYVNVPSNYVQSALATPVPGMAPKPKPTPTSMYQVFSTIKNHP